METGEDFKPDCFYMSSENVQACLSPRILRLLKFFMYVDTCSYMIARYFQAQSYRKYLEATREKLLAVFEGDRVQRL